jgi:hypothetical protein
MTNILIAIAAGCASALMYASIISGALFSLVLVYLTPLPLMVAALGWGPASALLGGIVAAIILALSFSLTLGLGYMLMVAGPAYWLGHVSLLAQPAGTAPSVDGHVDALEWYPIGRVVLWAASIAAMIVIIGLLMIDSSGGDVTTKLRERALQTLDAFNPTGAEIKDKERVASFFARALPIVAVGSTTLMYLFNLYLAGRIARTSDRLRRPWPDLHSTQLPPIALVILAAALLLLSFAGGLPALLAQVVGTALLTAYWLVGFAVLHAFTSSSSGRFWWRLAAYGSIVMFIWPLLLVPVLGLLDALFGLRRRFGNKATPPTLSS